MNTPPDVRSLLMALRVPPYLTTMVIPFVWMSPLTTDPDSAAVIEMIRGVQRGLRTLGYRSITSSGVLDSTTAAALTEISPGWREKTWVQIMGDVLDGVRNPLRKAQDVSYIRKGTGSYFSYSGQPPGPLPSWRAGTPPGPLGLGTTVDDGGVPLTWGQGKSNPSNMVPIPRFGATGFGQNTYVIFKGVQREINRLGGMVSEDGIIGTGTVAGLQRVVAPLPDSSILKARARGAVGPMGVAANAATLVVLLTQEASSRGIAKNANPPTAPSSSDTTAAPVTQEQVNNATGAIGANAAFKKYFPFVLLAGAVAWFASKKKKRK